MKFTHFILKSMVPEWSKLYVNFRLLKTYLSVSSQLKTLLVLAKKMKSKQEYKDVKRTIMSQNILMDKMEFDNVQFIDSFREEVEKIETFVIWKYQDLKYKMSQLHFQIKLMRQTQEDLQSNYQEYKQNDDQRRDHHRRDHVHGIGMQTQPLLSYDAIEQNYFDFEKNKKILIETFYTFYNECIHFQSYVDVNSEGVRKILKKYKKQMIKGIRKKANEKQYFGDIFKKMDINNIPNKIKSLLFNTEQLMIMNFYPTKPKQCRESLRKYSTHKKLSLATLFAFGFFAGFAFIFVIIIFFMRYEGYLDPKSDEIFEELFPCFRGIALFLIYYWCLALDVWAWNYFKINYKIYLGFNHHFSTLTEILQRVTIFSSIFVLVFVTYCLQAKELGNLPNQLRVFFIYQQKFMNPIYLPLILWLVCICYVSLPTKKILNGKGRNWMFKMIKGSVVGHIIKYESRYTFFTEQFVSMVIPFSDLDYTLCFYYHIFQDEENAGLATCGLQFRYAAMIASVLPFLIICLQQLSRARDRQHSRSSKELLNFLKNLLVMQLGIIAFLARVYEEQVILQYLWIVLAIICTLISFWWDVKQDWLLFEPNARYKFLRNDLGYHNPYVYYFLVALNLILRGVWTFSISPIMLVIFFGDYKNIQMLVFVVGIVELMRRNKFNKVEGLLSNFFKIEKEHITNQNNLKTVIDYKFPFEQKQIKRWQDMNPKQNNLTFSVSTFNQQFTEIEFIADFANEDIDNKSQQNNQYRTISQKYSETSSIKKVDKSQINISKQFILHSEELGQLSESVISRASINSPNKTTELQNKSNQQQQNNDNQEKSISLTSKGGFRLTQLVKKEQDMDNFRKSNESDLCLLTINLEILNKAKAQENLQFQKTLQIKDDNKKYKEVKNFIDNRQSTNFL